MEPFTPTAFVRRFAEALELREMPRHPFQQQALLHALNAPAGEQRFVTHETGTRTDILILAGLAWRFGAEGKLLIISSLITQEQWQQRAQRAGLTRTRTIHHAQVAQLLSGEIEAAADAIVLQGLFDLRRTRRSYVPALQQRFPGAVILSIVDIPAPLSLTPNPGACAQGATL